MRGKVSGARVLGYSLAGSVLFFLVTNFSAWIGSTMYPQNAAGLMAAYIAGIPFFQWHPAGHAVLPGAAVRRLQPAAPARAGTARADGVSERRIRRG